VALVIGSVLIGLWAAAGFVLVVHRREEPLGLIVLAGAALAAAGRLWNGVAPLAVGLLPAVGLHLLLGLPDGRLGSTARRGVAVAGYVIGAGIAVYLWIQRPDIPPAAPIAEAAGFGLAGAMALATRYERATEEDRRRLRWFGWAATVAAGVAVGAGGLRLLASWPPHAPIVAEAVTGLIPLGLVAGTSRRLAGSVDRLLVTTISLAGLTALVVAVYIGVVLGLGRVPRESERTLLVLSMVAAAAAAVLYLPAHNRLSNLARRIVYGGRPPPDDVLRTFGTRQSRSVPLDELLLQMAESLRRTLHLASAEVWGATPGTLERMVSDPEREGAALPISGAEESTLARAGVSGPAWAKVWLPDLLEGRDDRIMRLAPITHSGELLGLIVIDRPPGGDAFSSEDDRILTELARQVGLTLHNVRLDSALQASLDEVRRQAEALQASRGRIVAAGNAERRRIERNLHDGAQQHLVALAVKVRLARQTFEKDPDKARGLMEELGGDLEDALQELRDLAHGIYPPLLADKGLPEALAAAGRRASLPTEVRSDGIGRYSPEIEAAIYFCCLEALQNAGKHAGEGARVAVRIWEEAGGLLFEVGDDGVGFDTRHTGASAGFTNMNDRLGAVGGTLRVESAPGRGTKVAGAIPVAR
jgi:signal transduction histidine kinase